MKKLLLSISFLFILTTKLHPQIQLINNQWIGSFNIGNEEKINFEFTISEKQKNKYITILNGKEKIRLEALKLDEDSVIAKFINFPTLLKFKIISKDSINGRWINSLKKDYSIPFTAVQSNLERTNFNNNEKPSIQIKGEWKTKFYTKVDTTYYYSIGLFDQKKDRITGTFLTETGDYRYLAGNIYANEMELTAFDGSHVYLFKAKYDSITQKIEGVFKSGTHFHNYFTSERDSNFELKKSTEITYVQEIKPLTFNMLTVNNEPRTFHTEDYKNKVTLIQVMGTWCSNCVDETLYLKKLDKKYKKKGLTIIGLAFEIGTTTSHQLETIKNYHQKFDLHYPIYLGGNANKKYAAEVFKNIFNGIFSFPTTILLDKTGNIVQIHTGFNGPSTGKFYKNYTHQTNQLIKKLLK